MLNNDTQSATFLPTPIRLVSFSLTTSRSFFFSSCKNSSEPHSFIYCVLLMMYDARYPYPNSLNFCSVTCLLNSWTVGKLCTPSTSHAILFPNEFLKVATNYLIRLMLLFWLQMKLKVHSQGSCLKHLMPIIGSLILPKYYGSRVAHSLYNALTTSGIFRYYLNWFSKSSLSSGCGCTSTSTRSGFTLLSSTRYF